MVTRNGAYEEFEAICDWRHDDGSETLLLHLPAFKKEELKIQITNMKTLKISGKRPVYEGKSSRFYKEIRVPRDCNAKEIHAKFNNGLLQITMPKNNSYAGPKQEQFPENEPAQAIENSKQDHISDDQSNKFPDSLTKTQTASDNNIASSSNAKVPENIVGPTKSGSQVTNSRLKSFFKVGMGVAAVTVIVACVGALIVYSCLFLLA